MNTTPATLPTRPSADPALRHRVADAALTVQGPDGRPLAGAEVTVRQLRHRFLFGCIGFDFIDHAAGATEEGSSSFFGRSAPVAQVEELAEAWFELFNFATLPFYWGEFEPVRGRPATERLMRTARWFTERGARVKGHPLTWHTATADWLLELSEPEVLQAQLERIRREVGGFAGVIDVWDVVNEAVIMPDYDKYDNGITRIARSLGRLGLLREVFAQAREANPSATLMLNDFNLSPAYERLVEECLEAGIGIDALGLQSHMHKGYWGEERTLEVLERFSRFGLPLHLTENTLVSGELMPAHVGDLNDHQVPSWPSTEEGEQRQADEVARHYRTLVSHPSVQAVNYWGLSDAGAWLGAPVGLVRADGTRKPSFDALHGLVKGEWWLAPTTLTADAEGRVDVSGFLGDYEVTGPGGSAEFALDEAGAQQVAVRLG